MSKNKEKPPCGKTELLILEYLAKHKNSLIQPIEKGIAKKYKVVYEAVMRLLNNGLISKGEIVKQHTSYELSAKGIGFVWAYSTNFKVLKQSMENYQFMIGSRNSEDFQNLEKNLPENIMRKIFQLTGFSVLQHGVSAFDMHKALSTAITYQTSGSHFTKSEMRKVKRVALMIKEAKSGIRKIGQELIDFADSSPEQFDNEDQDLEGGENFG